MERGPYPLSRQGRPAPASAPVAFDHPLVRSRCLPATGTRYLGARFDLVIAMNVAHHIGLGRYGEAVDAEADLELQAVLLTMLVPNGALLLGLPLEAQDAIVWNAHRVYGPARLPLQLRYWHLHAGCPAR